MRKFCNLSACLKSMILKKKVYLKSTSLKKTFYSKSTILNKIFLEKAWFWIKIFCKKHDFDNQNFCLVRFYINFFTTSQILKNLPKSTTCTFHITFLHTSMYSYRLQCLRQLDNSIRLRSHNTFCTLFRKGLHF